jgi:hypothetical protein
MMETEISWQEGDTVTDLDTGDSGAIVDAGDGNDISTMEIDWEKPTEAE